MKTAKLSEVRAETWLQDEDSALRLFDARPRVRPEDLDRQVVRFMVKKFGMGEKHIALAVCAHKSSTISATYHVILNRLQRGLGFPKSPLSDLSKTGTILRSTERSVANERIKYGISEPGDLGRSEYIIRQPSRRTRTIPLTMIGKTNPICNRPTKMDAAVSSTDDSQFNDPGNDDVTSINAKTLSLLSQRRLTSFNHGTGYSDIDPDGIHSDSIYKEYLLKLKERRLEPDRGILKSDTGSDTMVPVCSEPDGGTAGIFLTCDDDMLDVNSNEDQPPASPAAASRTLIKSAKSVRFDVEEVEDKSPRETGSQASGLSKADSKHSLEKYAMRRLSAHAKSRRDLLVVAKLQSDKILSNRKKAGVAPPGSRHQYEKCLQELRQDGPADSRSCPAPPNSVAGFTVEQPISDMKKEATTNALSDRWSAPDRSRRERQTQLDKSSKPYYKEDDFCNEFRRKFSDQRGDRVVVWDLNVLDLDLAGEKITQRSKALCDLPVRRLGTLPAASVKFSHGIAAGAEMSYSIRNTLSNQGSYELTTGPKPATSIASGSPRSAQQGKPVKLRLQIQIPT